jgi:hypothetical protein
VLLLGKHLIKVEKSDCRENKSTFKNQTMITKKNLRIASLAFFMAITLPASSTLIAPSSFQTNSAPNTENTRAQQLEQRLEEIKNIDRSEMTRLEKKSLRKEVKAIKKEGKGGSSGVYLSVGAIIIIILLLILLL